MKLKADSVVFALIPLFFSNVHYDSLLVFLLLALRYVMSFLVLLQACMSHILLDNQPKLVASGRLDQILDCFIKVPACSKFRVLLCICLIF